MLSPDGTEPWHQAGVSTGELQVLAVLLGILLVGNLSLAERREAQSATVLAGLSSAPAAARAGLVWDQQQHQMCINFKCTINDTFFPWMRHIGCDAQSQGNVLSKAGAAPAALTW